MNLERFVHLSKTRNIVRFFPENNNDVEIIINYFGEEAIKKAYTIDSYDEIDNSIIYVIPTGIYDYNYETIIFYSNDQESNNDIKRMIEILREST